MRVAILGIDLQRLLGRGNRVGGPVLAHVQVGELGDDRGGLRIERHRALVGRHRAVSVVVFLETMGEKELVVRLGDRIDLGGRGGLRSLPALLSVGRHCATEERGGHHERNEQLHRQIVPQNFGVCHIFQRMAVNPELLEILVCPSCHTPVTLIKNGTALKCATCKRVYPIQDDIPVMLIEEATVEE